MAYQVPKGNYLTDFTVFLTAACTEPLTAPELRRRPIILIQINNFVNNNKNRIFAILLVTAIRDK